MLVHNRKLNQSRRKERRRRRLNAGGLEQERRHRSCSMGRFGGIATPSGVGCWSIASSPPPAIRHVSLKICWYLDTITQKVNTKYIRGRNVIYVNCNLLWIQSICSWKFIQPVIINRLSNINRIFHLKEKGGIILNFTLVLWQSLHRNSSAIPRPSFPVSLGF